MPSIAGKHVGPTGFGLMGFTWRPEPTPIEEAIKVMKSSLELGANFWNAGEFYGTPQYNCLHLLHAYFTKYPEDADKVVLSIKGGINPTKLAPDGTEAGVRRSVDACNKILAGVKKIDVFECARVDPNVPVEETMGYLGQLVEEGKIGSISLSEVRAETIRRAAKVQKIAGGVEIEFSLFAPDPLKNGIFEACAELGIPVVAYSPLGRGFLTGQINSSDAHHSHNPRAAPGAIEHNLKLVEKIKNLAAEKACTPGQLSLAWVKSFNGRPGMPTVIPIPGTTQESRLLENMKEVQLTEDDLKKIDDILTTSTVIGDRYPAGVSHLSEG